MTQLPTVAGVTVTARRGTRHGSCAAMPMHDDVLILGWNVRAPAAATAAAVDCGLWAGGDGGHGAECSSDEDAAIGRAAGASAPARQPRARPGRAGPQSRASHRPSAELIARSGLGRIRPLSPVSSRCRGDSHTPYAAANVDAEAALTMPMRLCQRRASDARGHDVRPRRSGSGLGPPRQGLWSAWVRVEQRQRRVAISANERAHRQIVSVSWPRAACRIHSLPAPARLEDPRICQL